MSAGGVLAEPRGEPVPPESSPELGTRACHVENRAGPGAWLLAATPSPRPRFARQMFAHAGPPAPLTLAAALKWIGSFPSGTELSSKG